MFSFYRSIDDTVIDCIKKNDITFALQYFI